MTIWAPGACRRARTARPLGRVIPLHSVRPCPCYPGLADGQGCSAALRFNLSLKGETTMNMMTSSQSQQPVSGGFRVDVSRGQRIGRVSSEWFTRPDDERYLNLPDLYEAVRGRAERAQARTVESNAIKVEANRDIPERLALTVPGRGEPVAPTHWSFGKLCTLVGAPTSYLRQRPAALCAGSTC